MPASHSNVRSKAALPTAALLSAIIAMLLVGPGVARAQTPAAAVSVADVVQSLVRLKTFINPDARTQDTLGREREGSGVVIDTSGLILTIGYLMVEAHAAEVTTSEGRTVAAEVVGYDHDTGFGLLRATSALKVKPMALGQSRSVKTGDPVIVAGGGGPSSLAPVEVVAVREFAGYWEYLLDEAIFTSPPVPWWSGAALVDSAGKLVGIGSLIVGDATSKAEAGPGNMFVPIDLLPPILGELIGNGRVTGAARPWLGMTTHEIAGQLLVARVVPGGPAEKAGIVPGDLVTGIDGRPSHSLSHLYKRIWSTGSAGTVVPLDVTREGERLRIDVTSGSRRQYLRLKSTF
jgi:S1-C subfamily serine protease